MYSKTIYLPLIRAYRNIQIHFDLWHLCKKTYYYIASHRLSHFRQEMRGRDSEWLE